MITLIKCIWKQFFFLIFVLIKSIILKSRLMCRYWTLACLPTSLRQPTFNSGIGLRQIRYWTWLELPVRRLKQWDDWLDWREEYPQTRHIFKATLVESFSFLCICLSWETTKRVNVVAPQPPPPSSSSSGCCKARNARRHLEQHCTDCKMQTGYCWLLLPKFTFVFKLISTLGLHEQVKRMQKLLRIIRPKFFWIRKMY